MARQIVNLRMAAHFGVPIPKRIAKPLLTILRRQIPMVTIKTFRPLALSFPEVVGLPHFDLASFRVKKKTFATLSAEKQRVMLRLSRIDQSVFCSVGEQMIYPVPGAGGKQGCTYFELKMVKSAILKDALIQAYCFVAPKALAEKFRQG